jgi:predicted nuclease of predicted toxin-antitoxin system
MKFLIDNALSPQIAEALRNAGFDTVHVREIGLHAEEDAIIFARAMADDRILGRQTPISALCLLCADRRSLP